jgi:hypothetical protein
MEVKLVFEMLNATPRYVYSHRWGYQQNGKWSGMIEDLYTGRADLGLFVSLPLISNAHQTMHSYYKGIGAKIELQDKCSSILACVCECS